MVNKEEYYKCSDEDDEEDIVQNDTREINVRITTKSSN